MINITISGEILSRSANDLLVEFAITEGDLELIKSFGVTMESSMEEFIEAFYARLRNQPYFEQFFPNDETVQKVMESQRKYWVEFFKGEIDDDYIAKRANVGEVHAQINLPLDTYLAGLNIFCDLCATYVGKKNQTDAFQTMAAVTKLLHLDGSIIANTYAHFVTKLVQEHADEMETKNKELSQFNKMAIDRELKMIELKKEINELAKNAGEEPRYEVV